MTTDDLLKRGIAALNAGRKTEARSLLTQVVEQDERNEMGWLWLSGAVDTGEDRRVCLENVLAINPNNGLAQRGLATLQKQGSPGSGPTSDVTLSGEQTRLRPIEESRTGVTFQSAREETATNEILQQAVAAIKSGEKERGRQLLVEALEQDEGNEVAWLWMTRCAADRDVKRECFERVLAINPDNQHAIEGLKRLEIISRVERPTKKRTGLIVSLGVVGLMLVVALGGIWWAFDSGFLQLGPGAPIAVETTQVLPAADATSTPSPSPTSLPTWTPTPRLTNTPAPTRTPRPTKTPRPTRTPLPPTPMPETKTIGPIWNTSRDESYTAKISVLGARFSTGTSDFDKPRTGYVFVVVDLIVENLGPSPMRYVSISDFQMLHEDGALYDYEFVGDSSDCHLPGVDLMAGGSTSGCVGFEVPMSGSLELIYAPYKYEGLKPGRYLSFRVRE
ncbi:MAG: DUF4352 domain-containing protein [Anaerolineae bacterium]|nr:DUF4352 domain-containing protein [Anaerolineae bacterium]